jgi:hypothetical protein
MMSKDQPKKPESPTTGESPPAIQRAKTLLERMTKTRADFTPEEREEAEAHGFWVPPKEK